jgi:hypothetical protein
MRVGPVEWAPPPSGSEVMTQSAAAGVVLLTVLSLLCHLLIFTPEIFFEFRYCITFVCL